MVKAKMMDCPECNGRGEVKHPITRFTCPDCNGEGEVERAKGLKKLREKRDYKTSIKSYLTEDGIPAVKVTRTNWLGSLSTTFEGKKELKDLRNAIDRVISRRMKGLKKKLREK